MRSREDIVSSPVRHGVAFTAVLGVLAPVVVGSARVGVDAIAPEFSDEYSLDDLGPVPGAPSQYGGVTLTPGGDRLLIGTGAVSEKATVYSISVVRGCFGEIVGFDGIGEPVAATPFIDGGLLIGPDDVLFYTTFDESLLGQIKPGSAVADRVVDLRELGLTESTGSATIVPAGFPGAGRLKIASYSDGGWYDANLVPDGRGTFDVTELEPRATKVGNGMEGTAWIAGGQTHFETPHLLVNNWDAERIDVLALDEAGDPVVSSRRTFASVVGPEGAAADPATSDIVISSLGKVDHVLVLRIVGPCAADVAPDGGDGLIGAADLLALLASWGDECTPVNFDREGDVGFAELLTILRDWGPCL